MNKQTEKRIREIELQKKAIELKREKRGNYSKTELNIMAKVNSIKNYRKYNKHDLAK